MHYRVWRVFMRVVHEGACVGIPGVHKPCAVPPYRMRARLWFDNCRRVWGMAVVGECALCVRVQREAVPELSQRYTVSMVAPTC